MKACSYKFVCSIKPKNSLRQHTHTYLKNPWPAIGFSLLLENKIVCTILRNPFFGNFWWFQISLYSRNSFMCFHTLWIYIILKIDSFYFSFSSWFSSLTSSKLTFIYFLHLFSFISFNFYTYLFFVFLLVFFISVNILSVKTWIWCWNLILIPQIQDWLLELTCDRCPDLHI